MSHAQVISPDALEADATVPQCLDNQFVSNVVFGDMTRRGVTYDDSLVEQQRAREAQVEFRRSLVYSTQVIVNRAFLVNSPVVFENYLPTDRAGIDAFSKLVSGRDSDIQAIVPYLHAADSLTDKFPFKEDPRGREALDALLQEVGGIPCVRLHPDAEENKKRIKQMEIRFDAYFSGRLNALLKAGDGILLNEMAAEVFGSRYQELQAPGAFDNFRQTLRRLAVDAFNNDVTRTWFYENWLVQGDTPAEREQNVITGVFRRPEGDDAFVLEVKKLIDLVYNTNVPDFLGRYTFTPVGMPSRAALLDFQGTTRSASISDTERLVEESAAFGADINRLFMANAQKAMTLPLLSDLAISDIAAIRRLDSWSEFSKAQQGLLQDPLNILSHLEAFSTRFNDFQAELSSWHVDMHRPRHAARRYANIATVALQIAGRTLIALGFPGHDAMSILANQAAATFLDQLIPKRVKGFMINLVVYVVDVDRCHVDADRSYSIELMRAENEYTRDQILDVVRQFAPAQSETVFADAHASQLSSQGAE